MSWVLVPYFPPRGLAQSGPDMHTLTHTFGETRVRLLQSTFQRLDGRARGALSFEQVLSFVDALDEQDTNGQGLVHLLEAIDISLARACD